MGTNLQILWFWESLIELELIDIGAGIILLLGTSIYIIAELVYSGATRKMGITPTECCEA